MSDVLLVTLPLALAFLSGWIFRDYQRFSREYDLWQYERAKTRALQRELEEQQITQEGDWSNVRFLT